MTTRMHASVVVPAFNGIAELPECLDALRAQEAPFEYEVIVIDSGSTDGTVEMLEKRAATGELRLHQIPNEEFGHGRTRNLGAKIARGEFVCFLTQDATPAHPGWLVEMLRPFDVFGPRMACVFGKQVPRPDCVPTVKRDVLNHFAGFGPDYCISVQTAGSPLLADESYTGPVGFFSDVNSAVRRSILLDEIPYEDVDYAEDQVFGRAVIAAGYLKA
ncbi:MAG: glycosyltransferase family 2 protein [Thermoleophilia bacterium]|nr:glycosyltransferase family 2 protein [Thermoleophilia bacterium]